MARSRVDRERTAPLAVLNDVSKTSAGIRSLHDVSLSLAPGLVAIVGDPNAGKSTLLHVVAGVKRADTGTVRVADTVVSDLDVAARRRFLAERVAAVVATTGVERARPLGPDVVLVVADDPTAFLSDEQRSATTVHLGALRGPGRLVLVATHDPVLIATADRVVRMAAGEVSR